MAGNTAGSLRVRLLFLVLLAVFPTLLLILGTNLRERQIAVQHVREDTVRLLRVTTGQHDRFIDGARQLLVALTQLPVVRDHSSSACNAIFGGLLSQYPYYANLGAADLTGHVFCSGQRLTKPINLAGRDFFQRAQASRNLAVGDYALDSLTGIVSVDIGYPIVDETGHSRGVVFAALDLTWLGQLVSEAGLPPDATFFVVDRNGTVLFAYPRWAVWMGVSEADHPLVKAILAQQGQGEAEVPNLEDVLSLFAFAPLRSAPGVRVSNQYLAVGIPAVAAFRDVDRTFTYRMVFFVAVVLLALVTAWWFSAIFIMRPTRALLAATRRLQTGELEARTGLSAGHGELSQLARAFDRMAERLQEHEAQLRRSLAETTRLKDLLDNVFASIASGVLTTDRQGTITLCNLAAVRILGYREATEMIGLSMAEIQPPLGTALLPHIHFTAHSGTPMSGLELNPVFSRRGVVHLRFNLSALNGPEEMRGTAIVMDDMTEKKKMEAQQQLLQRMVSPAILAQVDAEHMQLVGQRAEITTLFADLHGFTGIAEQLNPDELFELLNRYLGAMAEPVLAHEGTIDKFMGDAVMAWFNAPIPQPDHVMRAVRATLGIRDAIRALCQGITPPFCPSFGIGVHVGEAALGLVGSPQRMEYTAIGDDVNIAKRLQEQAGVDQILISAATYARVHDQVTVRPATVIKLKGKQKPMEVYELVGLK